MSKNQFYQEEVFKMLDTRFSNIEGKLERQDKQLDEIQGQLRWIYGWATGVGVLASVTWSFIKEKMGI